MKAVLASNNPGKLKEFKALFANTNIEIMPQNKFNVPEIEETGKTFLDNALLKARNASLHTHLPAIADDSGLEVDALNGKPGIYSARFAGIKVPFIQHIQKVLDELKNVPKENRKANFKSVLVFVKNKNDPSPIIAEDVCEGSILFEPIGKHGFGYDPVFYVESENCSMAQLSQQRKNQISHRGKAMRKLLNLLEEFY